MRGIDTAKRMTGTAVYIDYQPPAAPTSTQAPQRISRPPVYRPRRGPAGASFSIRT